jgi:23S rRNA (pseudouridine1915-N3)-methyltransferase
MILKLIAVGKLKKKFWKESVSDYARRIRPFARIEIIEVPEIRIPVGASPAEEKKVMAEEAEAILERLPKENSLVVVLDMQGKPLDSNELANWLEEQILNGCKEIAWIIGGPLGLAPSVIDRADMVLSFSRMTFPHQMMRLILLEQIYRSFRIIRHEPYHK